MLFAGEISPDKMAGDDSGPKRIVHKIRSEAKVTKILHKDLFENEMNEIIFLLHISVPFQQIKVGIQLQLKHPPLTTKLDKKISKASQFSSLPNSNSSRHFAHHDRCKDVFTRGECAANVLRVLRL